MTFEQQLSLLLTGGVQAWNDQRSETPFLPNFSNFDLVECAENSRVFGMSQLTPGRRTLLLRSVDLSKAELSECCLTGADLRSANLAGANLTRANLSRAILDGANLTECNLRQANLEGASFVRAVLVNANLTDAAIDNANFAWSNLSGAALSAHQADGTIFFGAKRE